MALAVATVLGCGDPAPRAAVRVVVPSGATFRTAADSLVRAGVIRSSRLFGLYAKLAGRDRALKPGTYIIEPGRSWAGLLDDLTAGKGLVATVTIPEGWSLTEIVPLLAARLEVPPDSVAAAVRDSTLRATLGVPTPTLEGYLFPETYTFSPGTGARAAVGEMVREFERRWRPEWTARLDSLGMTRHAAVTLASIVEKEARVADERPVIAAVYSNRLRVGMLLQADPTVQYALGEHVERVLYKHLETDSPYNTYRYPGLPPGPIASPGAASIEAAVHPAEVPYLYFVARADGRHEFRVTFAEHEQAIARIRREGRAERTAADSAPAVPRPGATGNPGRP
ncbi:MAG: endolytic transglycosylase MltG [Gemmatimonadaceae bacterium]